MNAALIGSVSSSVAALRGMIRGGLPLAGVLGLHHRYAATISDYHDLRPLAEQAGAPFLAFDKVTEPAVASFLQEHQPDWLFVVGLSQLVPANLRELVRAGAVGFHPTLLPEGRGRAPVAWTILLQRPAASNLFFLTDEPDAGDMIDQRPVEVLPDDYAADLIDRTNVVLEQQCADLSPAFASGQVPRRPQDHSKATYYARRRPEDGQIDWAKPADDVYRLVRAVSHPYPGAFSFLGGAKKPPHVGGTGSLPARALADKPPVPPEANQPAGTGAKVIIWRARPIVATDTNAGPGTITAMTADHPIVQTGRGLLELTDVEILGAPGQPLAVGQTLG